MKNQYYYTDFTAEALSTLLSLGFNRFKDEVDFANYFNPDFKLHIALDAVKKNFFILDNANLEENECRLEIKRNMNILPITLNEIQSWES